MGLQSPFMGINEWGLNQKKDPKLISDLINLATKKCNSMKLKGMKQSRLWI